MKSQDTPINAQESCPFCEGHVLQPIYVKNYKRCLDPIFLKQNSPELNLERIPHFLKCMQRYGIYRNPIFILSETDEHLRYKTHNNDLQDNNYITYLSKSFDVFRPHTPKEGLGLDYGCGPSKGFETLLNTEGYNIESYDKYFFPETLIDLKSLSRDMTAADKIRSQYDYIFCHEVIEHFVDMKNELKILFSFLRPKGKLFVRTELYPEHPDDFEHWYYKNDSTHVFMFSLKTFDLIAKTFNCTFTQLDKNKFILQKLT